MMKIIVWFVGGFLTIAGLAEIYLFLKSAYITSENAEAVNNFGQRFADMGYDGLANGLTHLGLAVLIYTFYDAFGDRKVD